MTENNTATTNTTSNTASNTANVTFGEVSWDAELGGKKFANSKDLFLRLDDGSNELRIVTSPFQYLVHKYQKNPDDKKDFGQKVSCSAIHGSCPLCATSKAKARWFLGVISRKTNTYKILDISYAVYGQIQKLAKNTARWGDPQKYDIDIFVDRNGGATGYYTVQPLPKEPLSATDQKIKDDADLEDLKRRVTPPTPENVQKRIDKINGADTTTSAPVPAQTSKPKKVATVNMDDDDDSPEFPSYDAK
jgi:hypothetical protein